MKLRPFIITALMIFAFFFGAGNLIFPPFAGMQAGTSFGWAYLGYILVDIGLSLMAILGVATVGRAFFLTTDLPKWMSVSFWLAIYLIIGPVFAVPRTSVVAYSISMAPLREALNQSHSHLLLFIFTLFFFLLTLWMVFYPGRIAKIVGGVLTPVLLGFILVLYGVMLHVPHPPITAPVPDYANSAFGKGLLQGYLTMDTLAALAFGAVIINTIRNYGITCNHQLIRFTLSTSILAGFFLAIVYFGLFYLGAISQSLVPDASNGGEILTAFVRTHLGITGELILSVIIILACLTTSVGLVSAGAEYFHFLYKRITYHQWAVVLSVLSMAIANLGLDRIIALSVPVVIALYPLAIIVIVTALLRKLLLVNHQVVVFSILVTFCFSLLDAIQSVNQMFNGSWLMRIPFFTDGLGWFIPGMSLFCIGMLITNIKPSAGTKTK